MSFGLGLNLLGLNTGEKISSKIVVQMATSAAMTLSFERVCACRFCYYVGSLLYTQYLVSQTRSSYSCLSLKIMIQIATFRQQTDLGVGLYMRRPRDYPTDFKICDEGQMTCSMC